jgi:hypothetical protein
MNGGLAYPGGRGRDRTDLVVLLLGGAALLVTLLFALMIGVSAWLPMLLLLALPLTAALVWIGLAEPSQPLMRALLAAGALLVIFSPALMQARLPLGYVAELLLFTWLAGALIHARRAMKEDRALRWLAGLFLLYLALSLASSMLGRSRPIAAAWQFQYNLKWAAMFLVGTLLVWDAKAERVLRWLLALVWLPLAAAALLELAAPGLHHRLFGPYLDWTPNPLIGALPRMRGPFLHSGYLALTAASFAWFCVVLAVSTRRWRWGLLALPYLALLLASGQRQECAGFVLALAGLTLLTLRRHWVLLLPLMFGTVVAAAVAMLMLDHVPARGLLAQWGFGQPFDLLSERAVLSTKGIEVANQWFPLGAGLGTYGGAGAQKFDQSLFIDLGFASYWWFRDGKFLIDVYWPSVAAESGWFGAAALAACYLTILFGLLRRHLRLQRDGRGSPLLPMALGALVILLSNTPTSAVITDPRASFVLWLLIGAAWRHTQTGAAR